ncbi:hypothetical protein ACHAQE_011188 [Botrytis cinerea]
MNSNSDQGPKRLPVDPCPYLSDLEKRNRLEHLKQEREKLRHNNLEIDALSATLEGSSVGQKVIPESGFEHGQNQSGSFLSTIVGKLNKGTEWLARQQLQANTQNLPLLRQHNLGDATVNPVQIPNQKAESQGAFIHGGLAVPSQQIDHTSLNYQQRGSRSFMNEELASSVFAPTASQQGNVNPSLAQNSQTQNSNTQHPQQLMNNRSDTHSQYQQYSSPPFSENQGTRPKTISTLPNRQDYRSPFTVDELDIDASQRYPQVLQYSHSTVEQPARNQRRAHFDNTQTRERSALVPTQNLMPMPMPMPVPINAQRQTFPEQQVPLHHRYLQHSSNNHSTPSPTQTHQVLGNEVVFRSPEVREDDDSTILFDHSISSVQQQQQQQQSQSVYDKNTNMYPVQESYRIPQGQNIPGSYATAHTPSQYPPYQHQSPSYCTGNPVIINPVNNSRHAFSNCPESHYSYPQSPYHHPSTAAQHPPTPPRAATDHVILPHPLLPPSPTMPTPQHSRDFTSFLHHTKKTHKKESLKDKAKIEAYQRAMRKKERARKINILVGMANEVKEDGDIKGDNTWGI